MLAQVYTIRHRTVLSSPRLRRCSLEGGGGRNQAETTHDDHYTTHEAMTEPMQATIYSGQRRWSSRRAGLAGRYFIRLGAIFQRARSSDQLRGGEGGGAGVHIPRCVVLPAAVIYGRPADTIPFTPLSLSCRYLLHDPWRFGGSQVRNYCASHVA